MSAESALSFPPDVFSKLEPELYLQRHLAQGLRPSNRGLLEFRDTKVQQGSVKGEYIVGSSVLRSGGSIVVCGISAGITSSTGGAGIYPNVEVVRGGGSRNSPPNEEEMILSQRIYELLRTEHIMDHTKHLFEIPGVEDQWVVLNASVQVLSRSGPVLDAAWNAVVAAIRSIRMPPLEYDPDRQTAFFKTNDDNHNNDDDDSMQVDPTPQPHESLDVFSSSYGIAELRNDIGLGDHQQHEDQRQSSVALVADVEGETEEACMPSTINIVRGTDGLLHGATISLCDSTASGGNNGIKLTRRHIQSALQGAKAHSEQLAKNLS
uniref:Ribosomal RNA-processing protein 43 n=1 Tax=Blastobotrys adeninivorans TaxID=409370 RepID=A0A060T8H5_BLAAD